MRTLERRISGSHQDVSLAKGTKIAQRDLAREFVRFLVRAKVLKRIKKSDRGPGYVLRVVEHQRTVVSDFSQKGKIDPILMPFFDRYLKKEQRN